MVQKKKNLKNVLTFSNFYDGTFYNVFDLLEEKKSLCTISHITTIC